MPKTDFTVRFVKDAPELARLSKILSGVSAFALDIETVDWWNRQRERIALIQIAFRFEGRIRVAIIDALAQLDVESLRPPLEEPSALKVIHNASFDAVRLNKHFGFNVAPVFDTMTAARRSGERKYSLKAQAGVHLNLHLDKSAQNSDWSRRPLDARQLHYAALDAYAALRLYENQSERGLRGDSGHCRLPIDSVQNSLPLENTPKAGEQTVAEVKPSPESPRSAGELSAIAAAILGIITELPSRYNPDGLAASVGDQRIGLAGWIIDQRLGADAEPDEESVKLAISELSERKLIEITDSRRLIVTDEGNRFWQKLKN